LLKRSRGNAHFKAKENKHTRVSAVCCDPKIKQPLPPAHISFHTYIYIERRFDHIILYITRADRWRSHTCSERKARAKKNTTKQKWRTEAVEATAAAEQGVCDSKYVYILGREAAGSSCFERGRGGRARERTHKARSAQKSRCVLCALRACVCNCCLFQATAESLLPKTNQ
jgi:hypothetical protein